MTPLRGLRRGSWYAVLGTGAVVLLPPQEKRRVPAVWALVDDGAGFDEVLDALIADGLRDLAGFALVSSRDGDARVVIRGGVTAVLVTDEGEVRVEGATAATWVEREARHVTSFRVEVDDVPDDGAGEEVLMLRDGVARVASVTEPPPEQVPPEPDPEPGPQPEPEPEPEAPVPGPSSARLLISTGETVDVDGPVVLGRAPAPTRSEAGEARLVTLPSPSREISSTHLEVRPASGPGASGVIATDLGSTNGTVVTQPGLPPEELPTGVPSPLLPGTVVDLGDGVSIEVVGP